MAAPLPPTKDRDRRRRGAFVAAGGEGAAGRRWLIPLLLLLALLVIAGIVAIIVAATHHSSSPAHPAAGASSATARPSASASPQATPPSTASAPAAGLPPFGLVGGGGVSPQPAAGKLAVTGSVGDILFAEDGTALDSNARQVVMDAAKALRQGHKTSVTVIGYTDAIGNAAANRRLSLERARRVIRALRPLAGNTDIRYQAEARGQAKPVASNSTARGRQLNRRVVIITS
jgi:outer membrane protein OmpA-like peptidoglycan-associated protein